jgi:predicted O-methyltransferase YrrM
MTYPWRQYPDLQARHVEGAKLFASRADLIRSLAPDMSGKAIAEVGVAFGDFSEVLLRELNPAHFVAFDLFNIHVWPSIWGKKPSDTFGGKTHPEFYRERFSSHNITLEPGMSWETLPTYPDGFFDLIYVDADHEYQGVHRDAEIAARKIKLDGILVFNDYIMYDHAADIAYGVVQAVNELVVAQDFRVIGFALERNMFCDIAITKARPPQ